MDIRRATSADMIAVWELVRGSYVRAGLAKSDYYALSHWDFAPETTVLVGVEDDEIVGTVSYTLDSFRALPIDEDYKQEVDRVRSDTRTLACVWRLAAKKGGAALARAVLKEILDMGVDDAVMQCHPRHRLFYERRFGFAHLGSRPETAGLHCAPSCLMHTKREVFSKHV